MTDSPLASLDLLGECRPDELASLRERLDERNLGAGEVLMHQGDRGDIFALVVDGEAVVEREVDGTTEQIAVAAPGSIVGELALLLHQERTATVRATRDTTVAVGDADDLEHLVGLTGVHQRMERLASRRLAEAVRLTPIGLRDGTEVVLRPLLPGDRSAYRSAIGALSADSLRRRFLSGGRPSSRMIDYLVDIDYVDHFAWVVQDPEHLDEVLGTSRFVRLARDRDRAEVAFEVSDDHQCRGIATALLGAIGVAASAAAIEVLVATVLIDNLAMRAVFDKIGASASFADPGEIHLEMAPDAAAALLEPGRRDEIDRAVRDIVTAAGLALTHGGR